jgi:hypothetical protein
MTTHDASRLDVVAEAAAKVIGEDGCMFLILVEGHFVRVVTLGSVEGVRRVIRGFVASKGTQTHGEAPVSSGRTQWSMEQFPGIAANITAHYPDAGMGLLVWFSDEGGDAANLWIASNMTLEALIDYCGDWVKRDARKEKLHRAYPEALAALAQEMSSDWGLDEDLRDAARAQGVAVLEKGSFADDAVADIAARAPIDTMSEADLAAWLAADMRESYRTYLRSFPGMARQAKGKVLH